MFINITLAHKGKQHRQTHTHTHTFKMIVDGALLLRNLTQQPTGVNFTWLSRTEPFPLFSALTPNMCWRETVITRMAINITSRRKEATFHRDFNCWTIDWTNQFFIFTHEQRLGHCWCSLCQTLIFSTHLIFYCNSIIFYIFKLLFTAVLWLLHSLKCKQCVVTTTEAFL